ncbi:MAG: hypothetical protein H8M99_00630 [Gloeobacteraceae cyanobacterium ES-bin-144]|nr:hypothetical protein [Verrucomicrobiales bacterium]
MKTKTTIAFLAIASLASFAIGKEEEETITLADTPALVRDAMTKEAGSNKIIEVEKSVENGVTTYELTIQNGTTKESIDFSVDGKVLKREKDDDKDDEKDDDKDDDDKEKK